MDNTLSTTDTTQFLKLKIEGMHCEACVRRVKNALHGVKGLAIDEVNVGSAQVSYNPAQTSPEVIFSALNGIGFKALQNG